MVFPETGLGAGLLAYGGLLVAVPLSFALLLRLIGSLDLDDYLDQYQAVTRDAGHSSETTPRVATDAARCRHCGERNDPEFSFCRSCAARVAA